MLAKITKPIVIALLFLAVLLMVWGIFSVCDVLRLDNQSPETKFIACVIILFLATFIILSIIVIALGIKEISRNFFGRQTHHLVNK